MERIAVFCSASQDIDDIYAEKARELGAWMGDNGKCLVYGGTSSGLMEEIVRAHFPNVEEKLLKEAMAAFYEIRGYRDVRKKPSTSELIDWIRALQIGGIAPETIRRNLPFLGVILKKDEDLETVRHKV